MTEIKILKIKRQTFTFFWIEKRKKKQLLLTNHPSTVFMFYTKRKKIR